MKKLKNHTIYQIINIGTGDELFINFKPTKKELQDICKKEFDWKDASGNSLEQDVSCNKIDIYQK